MKIRAQFTSRLLHGIELRAEIRFPANQERDKSLCRHDQSVKYDFTEKWNRGKEGSVLHQAQVT